MIDLVHNAKTENKPEPAVGSAHRMLTRIEAMRFCGMSRWTWEAWVREGRISFGVLKKRVGCCGRAPTLYAMSDLLRLKEELRHSVQPYPDPDRPGCYRVPVSSHTIHREAIIDADDLSLVLGKTWNWRERDDGHDGYVFWSTFDGPQIPLRRLILGLKGPQHRITHANGDPLDCRRSNLVVLTIEQQCRRSGKMGSVNGHQYTSHYKGVSWDSERLKWRAQIRKIGIHRMIGRHTSELEAARAYDQAAHAIFGVHAHVNFPEEWETEKIAA